MARTERIEKGTVMARSLTLSECTLDLPGHWVDSMKFERALRRCGDALGMAFTRIVIRIPAGCKMMIDVVIRLLSFCNQLVACTKRVRLEFSGGTGVMGYLDRMGFFDHLAKEVDVAPYRPTWSAASRHRGANAGLVEIERFSRTSEADRSLVQRLANTVERGCASRLDVGEVGEAIFTIFGELIANVHDHSSTPLDAFAALQTYPQGNRVTVAVSDSGIGIMQSLRPALVGEHWQNLSDTDLLVEIFREGLSSKHENKRGLGLKSSARHAIGFKADLDVRLPNQRVLLKPSHDEYRASTAHTQEGLPLVWGTHISFSLDLG
jgi:hypothetical protein